MQIETEIKASPHRTYFMTNEGIGSTSIGGLIVIFLRSCFIIG